MPLGFYFIMAAQFFSALADNALLIAAIAVLREMQEPSSYEPLLRTVFTISYIVLAAFVGSFADSMAKGKVMFISNNIKIIGCLLMLGSVHPLAAYAVVGLGAAMYSPAKYGILTEYLPHKLLVVANGWIEGLTVGAIVLGVVLGGTLVEPSNAMALLNFVENTLLPSNVAEFLKSLNPHASFVNIFIVTFLYILAAFFNLYVPKTNAELKPMKVNPLTTLKEFGGCLKLLAVDKLGQISLIVTTLFWGAGATLQFIVINWADKALGLGLSDSSKLQGVVAIGIAVGAVLAAKFISLRKSVKVIPIGILMGIVVMGMNLVSQTSVAICALIFIGALSGFFVVPMNALLQHRGHVLMGAGHSIAVQNFMENSSILVMTGLYFLMIEMQLSIYITIILFGLFVSGTMVGVQILHNKNQRQNDAVKDLPQ